MRLLALITAIVALAGTPAPAGSLGPGLDEALLSAGPDDRIAVVVMMEAFPARNQRMAEVRGMNRRDRRAHVVTAMKNLAEQSQRSVHQVLDDAREEIGNVRLLWGINGVAVDATPAVIERLVELPGVRWVLHDGGRGRPATGGDTSGPNPDATVRGEVIAMGAKQVWDELNYTGAGVIVAVVDTGVDRTHPDLADHIWTNLGEVADNGIDDDGNGFVDDTWGWDFCEHDNIPDSGSHGTQVAGQVAGDGTDGTVTGMAPDAELMVIGINCSPPDSIGWQASDYAVANGAHIITESYIWPWTEDTPDFEGWRRQTDTELAAGVIHVNAAGNDGGDPEPAVPYNVSTPANCPPPWLHPDQTLLGGLSSTVTVGNIEWSTDVIAPSSSIGPSAWEDIVANTDPDYPFPMAPEYMDYPYENGAQMGLLKPDLSAYGNGTYTTCPGAYYCSFSGTSSATPHVAGALALMLQSNPEATPAELTEAILTTAQHRGDPGKNNVYGTGLLQAYPAVRAVESGVLYDSHSINDLDAGNDDGMLDPGESVVMQLSVRSVSDDVTVEGLEAILSTTTPGVTIHNHHATYPPVPPLGVVASDAPHYSLTIDPGACTTVIVFDLELRFDGKVRRSTFEMRVGEPEAVTLLADDFESDLGWTSDPVASTGGAWVREDPIGVLDGQGRLANPEDDTSEPGTTCWVTGNGELNGRKDENNNDVDGGQVILLSPPFGRLHMLSLDLSYDRWFYDVSEGNSFKTQVSTNGGFDWVFLEEAIYGYGGWETRTLDLFALLSPTDDMRLRFMVDDDSADHPVEGGVDEVRIDGVWVDCQDYSPPSAMAPNPVGATLNVEADSRGHAVLRWEAPPVDGGHDAATLYRIERAEAPTGPFVEVGSATVTRWVDVDALGATESFYYRVRAEN